MSICLSVHHSVYSRPLRLRPQHPNPHHGCWQSTETKQVSWKVSFPLMIFIEKRWFDEWKICFILGASLSSDSCILSTKALGPIVGLKSWNSAFGRPKQEHALHIDHPLLEQGGNRIDLTWLNMVWHGLTLPWRKTIPQRDKVGARSLCSLDGLSHGVSSTSSCNIFQQIPGTIFVWYINHSGMQYARFFTG